jgi:DtxR family Mn-dependent transcriptional regulator
MATTYELTDSLEDYLEAIFHIIAEKQAARAKDISDRLGVGPSSVTGALKTLADKGMINYAPYDLITLTDEGHKAAADIVRRHEVLRDFFVKILGIENRSADDAACRMEHAIPRSILERLVRFAEFIELCPRGGEDWIRRFARSCDHGIKLSNCEKCVAELHEEVSRRKKLEADSKVPEENLSKLQPGEKGRVLRIRDRNSVSKRIAEMGVNPGTLVKVERVAPFGDPINIVVRGYHLSLRKEEAESVIVEKL